MARFHARPAVNQLELLQDLRLGRSKLDGTGPCSGSPIECHQAMERVVASRMLRKKKLLYLMYCTSYPTAKLKGGPKSLWH